jgi:hypothetical protein
VDLSAVTSILTEYGKLANERIAKARPEMAQMKMEM